jgi:hypothetical protein
LGSVSFFQLAAVVLEVRPETRIFLDAGLLESDMGKTLGGSSPHPAKPDEPPHLLAGHARVSGRGPEIPKRYFTAGPLAFFF